MEQHNNSTYFLVFKICLYAEKEDNCMHSCVCTCKQWFGNETEVGIKCLFLNIVRIKSNELLTGVV